jgi:hypothetical protein
MEKLPIKDVVELIQCGAAISNFVEVAKRDDGKIDFKDIPHALTVVPTIGPAIEDIDQVLKQLGDVDDEEFGVLQGELAKIGFIGNKAEVLEGVRVHFYAAKANYAVFQFWKNKA